jgi:hypothetical protein
MVCTVKCVAQARGGDYQRCPMGSFGAVSKDHDERDLHGHDVNPRSPHRASRNTATEMTKSQADEI